MNITTNNQLVSVNIVLSPDEALDAIKDPRELQRKLRQALGDVAPSLRRNSQRKPGPKGKGKARGGKATGTGSALMTTCSVCGKVVKVRGLGVHMTRKHPLSGAPAAGD